MSTRRRESPGLAPPVLPMNEVEAFLSTRFAELHAVAAITIGDPEVAVRVTADALADRWSELVDDGAPTMTSRSAVLTAALSAASRRQRTEAASGEVRRRPDDGDDADEWFLLTEALAAATPAARAALAAEHFWGESAELVSACAGADRARLRAELRSLRGAILRIAEGADAPSGRHWLARVERDPVAGVLERLAETPMALDARVLMDEARATNRRRRVRRRATAAVAVVTAAAIGAVVWPQPDLATAVPPLPPSAQEWAMLTTWSPRGPLIRDPRVSALVRQRRALDPGARLLWAGPVGRTTAVVMTSTTGEEDGRGRASQRGGSPGGGNGQVSLRLWTTSPGRGTETLSPTHVDGSVTPAAPDVVALSVKQPDATADPVVLVLTRPTVTEGQARTGARPEPGGAVRAVVRSLTVIGGVATFEESAGYPSRVTINNTTSAPAGSRLVSSWLPDEGSARGLADAQLLLLASVTGHPGDALDPVSQVDADIVLPSPACRTGGADEGSARLTVVTATTHDGGVVRTSRLRAGVAHEGTVFLERLAAVPAHDRTNALLPVPGCRTPTFIALAPGATRAELVAPDGHVLATATVTAGLAVLTTDEDDAAEAPFRLRLTIPTGRVTYDRVPPAGADLLE